MNDYDFLAEMAVFTPMWFGLLFICAGWLSSSASDFILSVRNKNVSEALTFGGIVFIALFGLAATALMALCSIGAIILLIYK